MADKDVNIAMELLHAFNMFRKLKFHDAHNPSKQLKRNEQMVIMYLSKHKDQGDLKISDLGKMLELAPSTISPIIHAIETNGLIERYHDRDDRRVVYIRLTGKGAELADTVRRQFRDMVQGLAEYLGREDTEKLVDILQKTFTYMTEVQQKHKEETK